MENTNQDIETKVAEDAVNNATPPVEEKTGEITRDVFRTYQTLTGYLGELIRKENDTSRATASMLYLEAIKTLYADGIWTIVLEDVKHVGENYEDKRSEARDIANNWVNNSKDVSDWSEAGEDACTMSDIWDSLDNQDTEISDYQGRIEEIEEQKDDLENHKPLTEAQVEILTYKDDLSDRESEVSNLKDEVEEAKDKLQEFHDAGETLQEKLEEVTGIEIQ